MVIGYTDGFDCPECASRQRAKVLKLSASGQMAALLQCVTCGTSWEPGSDQGERVDHDEDHTPAKIDGA